jgi:hypothetical protein
MKNIEKLLYSANIDMKLIPDPRYEKVRNLVETEYEKQYEDFRRTILLYDHMGRPPAKRGSEDFQPKFNL